MRSRPAALAALLTGTLALSGCSLIEDGVDRARGGSTPSPSASLAMPSAPAGAEKVYGQQLQWKSCEQGECAEMAVPLDWSQPDGETINVAVNRMKASSSSRRIGSIVVNPGGPGGSGVDYAAAADFIVGSPVRRSFDIVGFDPRGVKRSDPIDCLSDDELDDYLGSDPTPDDAGEVKDFEATSRALGEACKESAGPLLGHVSTVDAAKDMDVLRHLLKEPQLHYLGKSYGTFLGATYAELFPKNVGRFVLDGAVAPDLTSEELNIGQAEGFERATREWAKSCVETRKCPLGGDVDTVMEGLRGFLEEVDQRPIPKTGDPAVTELTEGWASMGVAAAMYDQGAWDTLTEALTSAKRGDGSDLLALANTYADREPGGGYSGNIMEVIYAVNCLDRPESAELSSYEALATKAREKAPTWGTFLAYSSMPCGFWPVQAPASAHPRKIAAEGSNTIVVVGTTRDPATPYEWSVRLNDQLANSALVTFDGDGHTAYTRSNSCVDKAIDSFYVDGVAPEDGLRC